MFDRLLRLSKHSFIYGFGVALSQAVSFFLIPIYTRYLTPADYGILEVLLTTMSILSVVILMGLTSALFMAYSQCEIEDERRKVVSTALLFLSMVSLVAVVLLVSLARSFSGVFFDSGDYATHFRLLFLTLFFDSTIMLRLAVFRAREEPTRYVAVTITRFVLTTALTIMFVVGLSRGVGGIIESHLITSVVLWVVLIPATIRSTGLSLSTDSLRTMIGFGLPLVPAGMSAWILTASDRYFLQFLSTPSELGLYSMGYKLGAVVLALIVGPFTLAWGPFIWSAVKEDNARESYSRALTYFFLVGTFVALGLAVLAEPVLHVIATPAFYDAHQVVPMVALSYVLYGSYHVLAVGYILAKKTSFAPLIVGVGAGVNLGLNYLLIPSFGMMGAALATMISYSLLPIGAWLVSRRYYVINYQWDRIIKILIVAVLVYGCSLLVTETSPLVAMVEKLAIMMLFPVLLFLFRFYELEEVEKVREGVKSVLGWLRDRL